MEPHADNIFQICPFESRSGEKPKLRQKDFSVAALGRNDKACSGAL